MRDCINELALLPPDLRSAIYEAFAAAYTTVPTSNSLAQLEELGGKLAEHFGEASYASLAAVIAGTLPEQAGLFARGDNAGILRSVFRSLERQLCAAIRVGDHQQSAVGARDGSLRGVLQSSGF